MCSSTPKKTRQVILSVASEIKLRRKSHAEKNFWNRCLELEIKVKKQLP
jgi:hypothetical protein